MGNIQHPWPWQSWARNAATETVEARSVLSAQEPPPPQDAEWTIEQRAAYAGLTVEQVRRLEP